jgi:hypothetical protein
MMGARRLTRSSAEVVETMALERQWIRRPALGTLAREAREAMLRVVGTRPREKSGSEAAEHEDRMH